jgi:hypothetical protein
MPCGRNAEAGDVISFIEHRICTCHNHPRRNLCYHHQITTSTTIPGTISSPSARKSQRMTSVVRNPTLQHTAQHHRILVATPALPTTTLSSSPIVDSCNAMVASRAILCSLNWGGSGLVRSLRHNIRAVGEEDFFVLEPICALCHGSLSRNCLPPFRLADYTVFQI